MQRGLPRTWAWRAVAALALAGLALGGAGCGQGPTAFEVEEQRAEDSTKEKTRATIAITPNPIEFPATTRTAPYDVEVTIEAPEGGSLRSYPILSIGMAGEGREAFTVSPMALPITLESGEALAVRLTFDPPGARDYAATLEVQSDWLGPIHTVPVVGRGLPPTLVLAPERIDFGVTTEGAAKRSVPITVRNTDTTPRTIRGIGLTANAGGFYGVENVPALPATIPGGATFTFSATLDPRAPGAFGGEVQIASDDAVRGDLRIPLFVDVRPFTGTNDEFQVNRSTANEQERPFLAALPRPSADGVVALSLFSDRSTIDPISGLPVESWSIAPITPSGPPAAPQDRRLYRNTAGAIYMGLASDEGNNSYATAGRYEISRWAGSRAIFVNRIASSGADFGGTPVHGTATAIPGGTTASMIDIAADLAGNRFVVWRLSGGQTGLYGRVLARDGTPVSDIFAVPSSGNGGAPTNPRVAFDGERVLAVWQTGGAVAGRLFQPTGEPLGPDFVVQPVGASLPRVAGDTTRGGFVVVWQSGGDVAGRPVTREGGLGGVQVLNSTLEGNQETPAVAIDSGSGTRIVVWAGPDALGRGIYGRRFDAEMRPLGSDLAINSRTEGDERDPDVVYSPVVGRWLVAWTAYDESLSAVRARFVP